MTRLCCVSERSFLITYRSSLREITSWNSPKGRQRKYSRIYLMWPTCKIVLLLSTVCWFMVRRGPAVERHQPMRTRRHTRNLARNTGLWYLATRTYWWRTVHRTRFLITRVLLEARNCERPSWKTSGESLSLLTSSGLRFRVSRGVFSHVEFNL